MAIAQRFKVRTSDGDEEMVGTGSYFKFVSIQERGELETQI